MGSIAAKPLSRRDIRTVAKIFHKIMDSKGYFDIIAFLELKMADIDPDFVFEVVEDDKLPFAYAQSYPDEHLIQVRESVYYGAINNNGRDRFTLCHELGHCIFHGQKNISYLRADRELEKYKDPEWQADTFAGELLVPEEIARTCTVLEISKKCVVSYTAAEIQKKRVLGQKNSHQTALKFGGVDNRKNMLQSFANI